MFRFEFNTNEGIPSAAGDVVPSASAAFSLPSIYFYFNNNQVKEMKLLTDSLTPTERFTFFEEKLGSSFSSSSTCNVC